MREPPASADAGTDILVNPFERRSARVPSFRGNRHKSARRTIFVLLASASSARSENRVDARAEILLLRADNLREFRDCASAAKTAANSHDLS